MPDQVKTPVPTAPPPQKQPDPVIKTPVTATVTQPPGGAVTHATKTEAEANIINQAEAAQQAKVREGVGDVKIPTDYKFMIEQGIHKVTISVENGMDYNFHVVCAGCAWEGRYLHQDVAEDAAKMHLEIKFPVRG